MSDNVIELVNVAKTFRFFHLNDICLQLQAGQIMGLIGPNGAGKSTTIRIINGLIQQDRGDVRVLGHEVPKHVALAKQDLGFVSEDIHLYPSEKFGWHMKLVASIFPNWDEAYAKQLLKRFNLNPEQLVKGLSLGERTKAVLLLVLARRPRLMILDEPTTGLDPVARHEVLAELMQVLHDENRSILFSSHNTQDVEQISDLITFIDRGRVIDSSDKETYLERWRQLHLELPGNMTLPTIPGVVDVSINGHIAIATCNEYSPSVSAMYEQSGAVVREVKRMSLEEIFVANVMASRKQEEERQ